MFSPFAKYQKETFCFNVLSSPALDSMEDVQTCYAAGRTRTNNNEVYLTAYIAV